MLSCCRLGDIIMVLTVYPFHAGGKKVYRRKHRTLCVLECWCRKAQFSAREPKTLTDLVTILSISYLQCIQLVLCTQGWRLTTGRQVLPGPPDDIAHGAGLSGPGILCAFGYLLVMLHTLEFSQSYAQTLRCSSLDLSLYKFPHCLNWWPDTMPIV